MSSLRGIYFSPLLYPCWTLSPPSQASLFNQVGARQASCESNLYIYVSIRPTSRLPWWALWCYRSMDFTFVAKTLRWAPQHWDACLRGSPAICFRIKHEWVSKLSRWRFLEFRNKLPKLSNISRKHEIPNSRRARACFIILDTLTD